MAFTVQGVQKCEKMKTFPKFYKKVIDRKYFHKNFLNDLHIGDNFCLLGKVNIFYCREYFRHFLHIYIFLHIIAWI
jgi:hypothetical protein